MQAEQAELDVINVRIESILQNVRSQQSEFNHYQCYNLGYAHDVLNIRSCERVVQLQHL